MSWVDPDDAPGLTDEFFANATPMVNGKIVSSTEYAIEANKRIGRPQGEVTRFTLNRRVNHDVLAALKASRTGWQT